MVSADHGALVKNWSQRLGLASTELFPPSYRDHHQHFVLLDGIDGSFALSPETTVQDAALDWTWSSQLSLHVTIQGQAVLARQVAPKAPTLRFNRDQVEDNLEGFFDTLVARQVSPPTSVVEHLVRCFRSHQAVAVRSGLTARQSLAAFLSMMGDLIDGGATALSAGLPEDHRDRFLKELRYCELVQRETDLKLTMRHAAGMVFQETHAELSTEPVERQGSFPFVLPEAPRRSTRNPFGAYYTPPGLARVLTDIAVAPYLDRDRIRIADPACGSGIFLSEAANSLRRHGFRGQVQLIGYDVSPNAVEMALFALKHSEAAHGAEIEVRRRDFLSLPRKLNADVVLMNPPFVAAPNLAPPLRDKVLEILGSSYKNRPDLSMAFTTLALSHLEQDGTLATLIPAGILAQTGARKWRSSIVEANGVDLIAVLGDHGLFRDAVVNIAALVLRKPRPVPDQPTTMLWASGRPGASQAALRRLRRWFSGDAREERTEDWSILRQQPERLVARDDFTPRPRVLGDLPDRLRKIEHIACVRDCFHIELGIRAGKLKECLQIGEREFRRLPPRERKLFRPVAEKHAIRAGRIFPSTWAFYPEAPLSVRQAAEAAPNFFRRFLKERNLPADSLVEFDRPRRRTNLRRAARIVSRSFIGLDGFAVDPDGSHVVIQGHSWLPGRRITDGSFDLVQVLTDYTFILNSRLFFMLAREFGRIIAGGQVDGGKRQFANVPLPDLPALYLEFPRLKKTADELRDQAAEAYPDTSELDRFAAVAYRTEPADWSADR